MHDLLRRLVYGLRILAGLFAITVMTCAQFREIGPAPFPVPEAHRRVRALLDQLDATNRQQSVKTMIGWLDWYRDVLDEELIATWRGDKRGNLSFVINELGDARVASEIVKSWRQPGLNRADAPILSNLMARYANSASPFLHDLLQNPDLSQPEAETVCRVLLDMPDRYRGDALRILPQYRSAAQSLLTQDLHESDQETVGRAQFWLRDLRWDVPGETSGQRASLRRQVQAPIGGPDTPSPRPRVTQPDDSFSPSSQPSPSPAPQPAPRPAALPQTTYNGARSGTLNCSGTIPQNAEFVFPGLPPFEIKLDYDTKTWHARLAPAEGGTQRLILRNISSGPQKKCIVHWSAVE